MNNIDIMAAIGMFFLAIGIAYAAYSYKIQPCNKNQ